MDLLQTYEASSAESDEDEDDKDALSTDRTDTTVSVKTDTDFFGIDADFESDDSNGEGNTAAKSLELDNLQVEVPQSSFWAALTSDDLKKASEKSSRLVSNADQFKNSSMTSGSAKRCHNSINTKEGPVKVLMQNGSDQCDIYLKDLGHHSNLQRKIFYVHSKIKPAIHYQTPNRPAESVELHIDGHGGVTNRVKWNIPQFSHLFLSAGMDSTVKVWNPWSTEDPCVRLLKNHDKAVKDAEWSSDGRSILSSSYDRCAVVSDVETGKQVCKLDHKSYVTCGKFHPVRRSQVVTGSTNCLLHWDIRTPDTACREFSYKDDIGQIPDILFSRDGNKFFTCNDMVTRDSADRNIMAWDYDSGVTLSNQIYQERYACTRLKLHPSTGHFLAQSHGGYIALFSVNRPFKMVRSRRFEGHKMQGYSIGFDVSRDGNLVYSGSSDGCLHCYDYQTGKLRHSFDTRLGVCMDVSCHPVLSRIVVGSSWGGSIKVFH